MRTTLALSLLLLSACGYKQEEFAVQYPETVCALYDACEVMLTLKGYETVEACEDDVGDEVSESACADFDKDAAQACLDGITEMSCEDLLAEDWPSECETACTGG